jgi:hypothetical protein
MKNENIIANYDYGEFICKLFIYYYTESHMHIQKVMGHLV